MPSWAAEELRYADLGDKRLNRRLIDIVSAKPTVSVPQACGTWARTKAVYRFWDNQRVTPEAILDGHIRSTIERIILRAVAPRHHRCGCACLRLLQWRQLLRVKQIFLTCLCYPVVKAVIY